MGAGRRALDGDAGRRASLTLSLFNEATIAWIEFEYHRKQHAEISTTPLDRYLEAKNVGRPCPDTTQVLTVHFVKK